MGSRRAPASPSRTHSCQELQPGYHNRWRLCGRRAKRVWLCPPSRVVVPPHPCRMPAEDTVRPRQCALQVAGPTQSQCHPTQPYTHPIQPHPVRTSLALQTYPALHIILSSPPHLLSSPLLWRGSGAGPRHGPRPQTREGERGGRGNRGGRRGPRPKGQRAIRGLGREAHAMKQIVPSVPLAHSPPSFRLRRNTVAHASACPPPTTAATKVPPFVRHARSRGAKL